MRALLLMRRVLMAEIVVFVRSRPFFGAQLVMFPALHQLKKWWPHKTLRVVARDNLRSIFEGLPWVDEFVHAPTAWAEFAALHRQCDLFVGLHPSSEWHALVAGVRRPRCRLGYRNARVGDMVWTHSIPFDAGEYRALHFLKLLQSLRPFNPYETARESIQALADGTLLGMKHPHNKLRQPGCTAGSPPDGEEGTPSTGKGLKHALLPANPSPSSGNDQTRVVTMMPGGGAGEFKKWGLERFMTLAQRLSERYDVQFNVVLGPAEQAEASALADSQRDDLRVWVRPSLPELARVVVGSDLVVANDCGPSHVAQCSGVPFVGLFDAHKPEWFWQRDAAHCLVPTPGAELQSLPVDDVAKACEALLSGGKNALAASALEAGEAEAFGRMAGSGPIH